MITFVTSKNLKLISHDLPPKQPCWLFPINPFNSKWSKSCPKESSITTSLILILALFYINCNLKDIRLFQQKYLPLFQMEILHQKYLHYCSISLLCRTKRLKKLNGSFSQQYLQFSWYCGCFLSVWVHTGTSYRPEIYCHLLNTLDQLKEVTCVPCPELCWLVSHCWCMVRIRLTCQLFTNVKLHNVSTNSTNSRASMGMIYRYMPKVVLKSNFELCQFDYSWNAYFVFKEIQTEKYIAH